MATIRDDDFNVLNGHFSITSDDEIHAPDDPNDNGGNDFIIGRDGISRRKVPLPGCSKKEAKRYENFIMKKHGWGR